MRRIFFIAIAAVIALYVIHSVRRNKLTIKESFWWVIGALVILVLAIFPQIIDWGAGLIGVSYPPALLLTFGVIFLLLINFRDSRRIADQQVKIIELAQQISLLKGEIIRGQKDDTKKFK